MKITFLTDSSSAVGTYFRSHNLAVGLDRMGHDVLVFTCDHDTRSKSREERRDGITYKIVAARKGQRWFGATHHPLNALFRAIADYPRSDIVHLFQPFSSAAFAWLRLQRRGSTEMWYDWDDLWTDGGLLDSGLRTTFAAKWDYYWTQRMERTLPGRAGRVSVCSEWLAKRAIERGANSVTVVGNGFWPVAAQDRSAARSLIGLSSTAKYMGFMGRSRSGQEVDWCIEGFAENAAVYPCLRFAVCGIPTAEFDAVDPILRSRIDALGILPPSQATNFAAAIDLGLIPMEDNRFNQSRFPVRFAHLLASGTPVLCSRIGELTKFFDLPGVLPAGCTRDEWRQAHSTATARLATGELPAVDMPRTEERLSWMRMARQLAAAYEEGDGGCPRVAEDTLNGSNER